MANDKKKKDHIPDYFKSGPLQAEKRSCTDILCCIIFLCFTLACLGVAAFAF